MMRHLGGGFPSVMDPATQASWVVLREHLKSASKVHGGQGVTDRCADRGRRTSRREGVTPAEGRGEKKGI